MDAYELMERTDTTPTVKAAPPASCPRCGTQRVTIHSLNGRYWIACHHDLRAVDRDTAAGNDR